MRKVINNPKWWRYTARFFIIVTIVVVVFSLFCLLATNYTDELGQLLMGIYFVISLYASFGLFVLALIGIVTGFILKYSLRRYMITVSLLPTVFYC